MVLKCLIPVIQTMHEACCMQFSTNLQLYKIFHCSYVYYSTMDGQLNCLPFQIVFHQYHKRSIQVGSLWLVEGGGEPWSGRLNNMSNVYNSSGPQLSPIVAPNVKKVAKSLDNITSYPCGNLQSSTISRAHYRQLDHSWMSETACKVTNPSKNRLNSFQH